MALVREEVGAVLDKTSLEQTAALGLGSDADPPAPQAETERLSAP